jgi:chromosome segregation ATPase
MNKTTAKKIANIVMKIDSIRDQLQEILDNQLQDAIDLAQERLEAAEEYQGEHPNSTRADERAEAAQERLDEAEAEYNSVQEYIDTIDYDLMPESVTELLFC